MTDNEIQEITVDADVISEDMSVEDDSKSVIIGKPYIIITLINILVLMLSTAYFVYLDIANSRATSELEDMKQQLAALEQSVEDYKTTIAEHEKKLLPSRKAQSASKKTQLAHIRQR